MRVDVDLRLCENHAQCVFAAPDVFEIGEDEVLTWRTEVDDASAPELELAAASCPVQAIRLSAGGGA